ncbi:E3 ubiquitin-protein ligase UPL1 [Chlorella vulgaris]
MPVASARTSASAGRGCLAPRHNNLLFSLCVQPEAVRAAVEAVVSQPLDAGDVHHWVQLFDHFDAYFDKHLKGRHDLCLDYGEAIAVAAPEAAAGTSQGVSGGASSSGAVPPQQPQQPQQAPDPPFPRAAVLSILRVTALILEGCSNKHLYSSYEYLSLLLAAPDADVVLATLHALAAFVRKSMSPSTRWNGSEDLNARLMVLAGSWGSGEEVPDLLTCAQGGSLPSPPTGLHFQFYAAKGSAAAAAAAAEAEADAGEGVTHSGGVRIINVPAVDRRPETDHQLLEQLVREYGVPVDKRFALLHKIRTARAFAAPDSRQVLLRLRLISFYVAFQSNPSPTDIVALFQGAPDFVHQLAALLRQEAQVPDDIQTLALRSLAVQLLDRSRHSAVIAALSGGEQSGLLSLLIHGAVASLTGREAVPVQYSQAFVEALLSMVGALVTSTSGTTALSDASLVPALLPLLQHRDPAHLALVSSTVRILEAFMDFSPASSGLFRELGGLRMMVDRLRYEVEQPAEVSSAAAISSAPAPSTALGTSGTSGSGSGDAMVTEAGAASGAPPQHAAAAGAAQPPQKTVPYGRRLLLKSLLRAIAMASYTPNGAQRADERETAELYACVKIIFQRSKEFGGGLFALSASVVADTIHHDPLVYSTLDAAGLPQAFLDSVAGGVLVSMEAVAAVPHTLMALCLNSGGLKLVKESKALRCLVPIFSSKQYVKALQGESSVVLGAGLDELLRHVPQLRPDGVDVVIRILRRQCMLGGELNPPKPPPAPPAAPAAAAGEAAAGEAAPVAEAAAEAAGQGAAAMETDAAAQSASQSAAPAEAAMEVEAQAQQAPAEQEAEPMTAEPAAAVPAPAEAHATAAAAGAVAAEPAGEQAQPTAVQGGAAGEAAAEEEEEEEEVEEVLAEDPEAETYLVECVTYTARMLESMLTSAETAKLFVERGGVELLLTLYRLPRLPPTFGSTNASHSLLVSFRVFTTQHSSAQLPHIFGLLRAALLTQLDAALAAARQVGGACVPLLPAQQREAYIRQVSSTEGLAALAATVVRNASSVLKDISNGDMSVILKLGELERMVLWQAAVADEWRLEQAVAKAAEEKAAATAAAAPGGDQEMVDSAAAAAGGAAASASASAAAAGPVDEASAALAAADSAAAKEKEKKRKSPEELSCDILLHFAHTARAFDQAVAKAIHVPVRRREEAAAQPTMAMRAAAVNLAVVLRRNFDFQGLEVPGDKGKEPAGEQGGNPYATPQACRVRYLSRVLDASFNILFDGRRRTTHTLVYNYFMATGGMRSFLKQFEACLELLRQLPPEPAASAAAAAAGGATPAPQQAQQAGQQQQDIEMADTAGPAAALEGGTAGGTAGATGGTATQPISPAKAYRQSVEAAVGTFLVLMTNMSHAPMVVNSPNSANHITAPLPGAVDGAAKPAEDAPSFMRRAWGVLLAAVLPLWNDPALLAAHGDKIVQSVVSVLRNCTENAAQLAAAMAAAARSGARGAAPALADPARVQQIAEMGFSRAQAEEALRRNGNHVELAMEWLIVNPEAAAAAEAAATAGGAAAQHQVDDQALAQMVAATLSVGGAKPGAQQEGVEEVPTATMPDTPALVDSAVNLIKASPRSAFYVCDLLKAHSAQSSKHRQTVLERLMWHLSAASSPTDAQLFAPAHVAALLLSEVAASREVAAEKGFASIALDAVDAWTSAHLPPPTAALPAADGGKPSRHAVAGSAEPAAVPAVPVPRWVDTLLLSLDILASTPPKPPPPAASTSGRAGSSGRAMMDAIRGSVAEMERILGLPLAVGEERGGAEQPAAQAAPQAEAEPAQPAAATPAAAGAGAEAAAAGVHTDSGSAPEVTSQAAEAVAGGEQQTPSRPPQAGAEDAAPAAPQRQQGSAEAQQSPEEQVFGALAAAVQQYSTGGSLNEQEQQRTVEVCLRLLRHLHSWGASWTPQELAAVPPAATAGPSTATGSEAAAAAAAAAAAQEASVLSPDPRSTLHAVVQLLARLTKDHALAEKVLAARGHVQLLTLPPAAFRPELEPFMAAVFRHILEDPSTLQAAMEAEIRSTLNEKGRSGSYAYSRNPAGGLSLPMRTFLTALAPVAARQPRVFVAACRATVEIKDMGGLAGRRTTVVLKKKQQQQQEAAAAPAAPAAAGAAGPSGGSPPQAQERDTATPAPVAGSAPGAAVAADAAAATPAPAAAARATPAPATGMARRSGAARPATEAGEQPGSPPAVQGAVTPAPPKTAGKSAKKVPPSFLEVIDCLVDVLLRYNEPPAELEAQGKDSGNAAQPSTRAGDVHVVANDDGTVDLVPSAAAAAAAAQKKLADEQEAQKASREQNLCLHVLPLTPGQKEVAVQCFALRLLSDFTLMYQHCVGVLLKRDTDLGVKEVVSLRSSMKKADKDRSAAVASPQQGLFRHIMDVQLALAPAAVPRGMSQGMGPAASYLLLAICIRSAEGRRRIVSEIVSTLLPEEQQAQQGNRLGASAAPTAALLAAADESPYISKPGCPLPFKVKAFVDLAASLLSTTSRSSPSSASASSSQQQTQAVSAEIVRAMKEAGMAIKAIHAILRPMEILTRASPKRPSSSPTAGADAATTAGAAGGATAGPASGRPAGGRGGEGGRGGGEGVPGATPAGEAPEAGRQALQAAEAALENLDRDRARAERRTIEEAIEGLMAEEEALLGSDADMLEGGSGGSSEGGSFDSQDHDGGSGMSGDSDDDGEGMSSSSDEMGEEEGGDGVPLVVDIETSDDEHPGDGGSTEESDSGLGSSDDDSGMDSSDMGSDHDRDEGEEAELAAAEEEAMEDEEDGMGLHGEDEEGDEEDGEEDEEDEVGLVLGDGAQTPDMEDDYYEEADELLGDEDDDLYLDEAIADDEQDEEAEALRQPVDFGGPDAVAATRADARTAQLEAMLDEYGLLRSRNRSYVRGSRRSGSGAAALSAAAAPATQHPLLLRPPSAGGSSAAAASALAGMDPAEASIMQQAMALSGVDPTASLAAGPYARIGGSTDAGAFGRTAAGAGTRWGDGDAAAAGAFSSLAQSLERAAAEVFDEQRAAAEAAAAEGRRQPTAAGVVAAAVAAAVAAEEAEGAGDEERHRMEGSSDEEGGREGDHEADAGGEQEEAPAAAEQPAEPAAAAAAAAPIPGRAAPGGGGTGRITADVFAQAMAAVMNPGQQPPAAAAPPAPPPAPAPAAAAARTGGDADMQDASRDAAAAAAPAAAPAPEAPAPGGATAEPGGDGGGIDPAVLRAAEAAGIDAAFLEALPPELRSEVLAGAGIRVPPPQTAAPAAAPAAPAPAAPAAAAAAAAPAAATGEGAQPAAEPAAPAAAAAPSGGDNEPEAMEGIDPEFLAALPAELQAEVMEQQRRERRLRAEAARRREAQAAAIAAAAAAAAAGGGAAGAAAAPGEAAGGAAEAAAGGPAAANAAAAGGGGGAAPADMDFASLLASFPPDVREEVLMSADEALLATLPPALMAEAQSLQARMQRHMARNAAMSDAMQAAAQQAAAAAGALQPGEEVRMRLVYDGRSRQPRIEYVGSGRRGGRGTAAAAAAAVAATTFGAAPAALPSKVEGAVAEPPVQMDEDGLLTLVRLLRLGQPLGKGQLQRLFHNLCANTQTRESLLRLLLSILRGPLTSDELDVVGGAMEADGRRPLAEGPVINLGLAPAHEGASVPQLVHHSKVPGALVMLHAPELEAVAARAAARLDKKGKGKRPLDDSDAAAAHERPCLEVLLGMPSRTVSRRSEGHMVQSLELLSSLLRPFEDEAVERQEKQHRERQEKEKEAKEEAEKQRARQEQEQSAAAMQTDQAQPGAPAAEASPGGSGTQQPLAAETAAVDVPRDVAGGSAAATAPSHTVQQQQEAPNAGEASGAAAAPQQQAAGQAGVSPAPAAAAAKDGAGPSTAPEPAAGGAAAAAEPAAGSGKEEEDEEQRAAEQKREEEERLHKQYMSAFDAVPLPLLLQLPALMAEDWVADRPASVLKMVIQGLNVVRPSFFVPSLSQLAASVLHLASVAEGGLRQLAGMDPQSASVLTTGVARYGKLMLRPASCFWENVGQMVIEQRKRAPAEVVEEFRCDALAVLEDLCSQLEPLWMQLSHVAAQLEAGLKISQAADVTKVLPPGAAQVQPLVEVFFVLADVRLASFSAGDRAASMSLDMQSPTASQISSMSGAMIARTTSATAESRSTFMQFAEQHRRLINVLVHHKPELLQTSMSLLLRAPKLLDFDNKRAYFRTQVKDSEAQSHYGSMRLHVRREHVFEDSFYQLRMRSTEEMRAKLNVVFTGEEGVDAGGVTREWYQVMSREMFNPQFSLFMPVPEGGTTFQPNPNSVIQNDEARGTNHLDFFKFVGRVVAKALYDGQLVDAHFTRSFYKHVLGQPLTYGDIEAVDPEFYRTLRWMLENDITDVLDLVFAEETDYFGRKSVVELRPGGKDIKVTNDNKGEYVNAVARHRMTTAIRPQIDAFLKGFWEIVPRKLISLFNDHELELLICGLPEIDVDDLRANTEYTGYTAASPVVQWFWELVREMDKQDLALLVQFVTGTSKVPLDGFKALQGVHGPQRFQIHKAYGAADRLPSAHTCFNQLDMLEYESKEQLRDRLLLAIHEGSEGFGFA